MYSIVQIHCSSFLSTPFPPSRCLQSRWDRILLENVYGYGYTKNVLSQFSILVSHWFIPRVHLTVSNECDIRVSIDRHSVCVYVCLRWRHAAVHLVGLCQSTYLTRIVCKCQSDSHSSSHIVLHVQ